MLPQFIQCTTWAVLKIARLVASLVPFSLKEHFFRAALWAGLRGAAGLCGLLSSWKTDKSERFNCFLMGLAVGGRLDEGYKGVSCIYGIKNKLQLLTIGSLCTSHDYVLAAIVTGKSRWKFMPQNKEQTSLTYIVLQKWSQQLSTMFTMTHKAIC